MKEHTDWDLHGIVQIIQRAGQGNSKDFQKLLSMFEPLIKSLIMDFEVQFRDEVREELIIELFITAKRFKPVESEDKGAASSLPVN